MSSYLNKIDELITVQQQQIAAKQAEARAAAAASAMLPISQEADADGKYDDEAASQVSVPRSLPAIDEVLPALEPEEPEQPITEVLDSQVAAWQLPEPQQVGAKKYIR